MATGRKPTVEQLRAENDYLRRGALVEEVGKTVRVLVVCTAFVTCFYFLQEGIATLAGKRTDANILIKFLSAVEVSVALGWAVGIGGTLYGRSQMKLRKRTIERMEGRIKELEQQLDPNRTSSNLTKRGDTRPGDK